MTNDKTRKNPQRPLHPARAKSKNSPNWADPIARQEQSKLEAALYVTATPIGNLHDITLRALASLAACDLILCEDTRVTRKLLTAFDIAKPLKSYHDHNAAKMRPRILDWLREGMSICLVSDAGMPLVSDPGYQLVRAVQEAGLKVTVLPGASAPLAALVLSGLPSDSFFFAGFLPAKAGARQRRLSGLQAVPGSLIFFESGPRLGASLQEMKEIFGPREAAIAREITKIYEEVRRGTLETLAEHYASQPPPKGEIVIVVAPPVQGQESLVDPEAELRRALKFSSTKKAVAEVAALTGLPRKQIYDLALSLKTEGDHGPD